VLSSKEFAEFSKQYVMFCHVTTRIEGRKDDDLLSKKGGNGFPYLVAMDANGDVIAQHKPVQRTLDSIRSMMGDGAKFQELRAKPGKTLDEEVSLLQQEVAYGNLDAAKAKERVAGLKGLSDAQKKDLDGAVLGLEIRALLPKGAKDKEAAKAQSVAAGKAYAEMWAAGREPTSDETIQPFFICMLDHAEAQKDAALFEKALEKLRAKFGSNPNSANFFKQQDERLAALKAGGSEPKKDGEKEKGAKDKGGKEKSGK
jgi:hypothetical protein